MTTTKLKPSRHVGKNGSSPPTEPIKLDLSYGDLPQGHPFARHFDPLFTQTWPLKSGTVSEAYSAFMLNRVPAGKRGQFMDELWRVLVPGGKCTIIVPYWTSARSVQDPTSEWPPLCEQSFLYFNRKFREDNKVCLEMQCDFDFVYGYTLDSETQSRPDETRSFWIKHYTNSVNDLHLTLTKRP